LIASTKVGAGAITLSCYEHINNWN
jgi:hypothetical protein